PEQHDEEVRWIAALPDQLDEHVRDIEADGYRRADLEKLTYGLRKRAFNQLLPQHHQFAVRIDEISLDMRKYMLCWARQAPSKEEMASAVRGTAETLRELVAKYCSPA